MTVQRDRTRNSGDQSETAVFSGGPLSDIPVLDTYSYVYAYKDESMSDTVIDRFHARIALGEVINNNCEYEVEELSVPAQTNPLSVHIYDPWGGAMDLVSGSFTSTVRRHVGFPGTGYFWNTLTCPDPTLDTIAAAKQKCLANVDSTPYDFFEDLLEIRETLRFLADPLESIKRLGRYFARRKNRLTKLHSGDAIALSKALANLWNSYRFALAPLVRTLMSGLELFDKWSEIERAKRRSAHATSEDSVVASDSPQIQWGSHSYFYYTRDRTKSLSTHATILYEVTNPVADWSYKVGLRLKDIPSALWEIMPLSFMVDRLYDVQSLIEGLMNLADPSVVILASSTTTKTLDQVDISCWKGRNLWNYAYYTITNPDVLRHDYFGYSRVVWYPTVSDTVPVFDWRGLVDDYTKIADLAAISISRFL